MSLSEADIHALETQLATLIGPEFVDQARAVLPELFAEIRELRRDAELLNWLEQRGFSTVNVAGNGPVDAPGVHSWRDRITGKWKWTAHWISSEFSSMRDAIRAAIRGQRAISLAPTARIGIEESGELNAENNH